MRAMRRAKAARDPKVAPTTTPTEEDGDEE